MLSVYKKTAGNLFILLVLATFTFLSACAPSASNGQEATTPEATTPEATTPEPQAPVVPRPKLTTVEASSVFDVSATINGEDAPVIFGEEDFYVIGNDEFSIGIFFSPDRITTFSVEDYEAWSETADVFESLSFLTSFYENDTTGFELFVINESQDPMRVVWDETAIVNIDGSASGVIHEGVRFSEMNNSQSPTTIPPGARIEDYVGPTDNISLVSGDWTEFPLFTESIEEGDTVSIFLALEVGGDDRNVNVTFEANSAFAAGPTVALED